MELTKIKKPSTASRFSSLNWTFAFVVVSYPIVLNAQDDLQSSPDFETVIAPLLIQRCIECHQGEHPAGGLRLTSKDGLDAGGDSGEVIDHDEPAASYLLERLLSGEMPPDQQGQSQRLTDRELDLIQKWVSDSARWPKDRVLDYFERTNDKRAGRDWWSLQPVIRPGVPTLTTRRHPNNPIDAFIQAKLEQANIEPSPIANRRTLIRRLYYDLIGLPPSEDEISRFYNDDSPSAWPKLVDRLLATPAYGERWARYWLDLARYADTSGYERDQEKPYAWKYRDWVVDAFNQDMPYSQFITEQIAGDEVPNRTRESVIATGFLRLGTWNDEPNDRQDYQYERLEDLVHTTSSTFFAMTVKCARCHSHKFDAIQQDDYYRMASAFWPGPLLTDGKDLGGPKADQLGFQEVLGWTDITREPAPLRLLKNGERSQPLSEIKPASLSFIPQLERNFRPPPKDAPTSHRRLQLAQWIAEPTHPLTSRVLVNRLWQHHFGKAIVRTPNNFGFLAAPATHPKLLDWLASEFEAQGRSIKWIHRLILTSQTWQQSVLHPEADQLETRDSENQLWWRAERRRLDAETLRDSLLAVSGELMTQIGGPGFKATINPEALEGLSRKSTAWQPSPKREQTRRSLYMYLKRGLLPPMMTAFDLCDPTLSCGQRNVTTVPTQALTLMNNLFVHDRSEKLAETIRESTNKPEDQARLAWKSILKREPTDQELNRAVEHLSKQANTFIRQQRLTDLGDEIHVRSILPKKALVLHLKAAHAVVTNPDSSLVQTVPDLSGHRHHAHQMTSAAQPHLVHSEINGKPTLRFDGKSQYMKIDGQVIDGQQCTFICVAVDRKTTGHRALISNWSGRDGNSTSSIFLGLTQQSTVRFSDAFGSAGDLVDRRKPFLLTAINSVQKASVYQNGRLLKSGKRLTVRRLDTPWVIAQQGNINGEFWMGDIAEILVFKRDLQPEERNQIEAKLAKNYGITLANEPEAKDADPSTLALASLCHVLMNTNEFVYVD